MTTTEPDSARPGALVHGLPWVSGGRPSKKRGMSSGSAPGE